MNFIEKEKKWSEPHKYDPDCPGCKSNDWLRSRLWWKHEYDVDGGSIFKVSGKDGEFYCLVTKGEI